MKISSSRGSAFDAAAECKQRQTEKDGAGQPQQSLEQPAHAVSLTSLSVRDNVARNAYSRLVQYEAGRGGVVNPIRWKAIANPAITAARQASARQARSP